MSDRPLWPGDKTKAVMVIEIDPDHIPEAIGNFQGFLSTEPAEQKLLYGLLHLAIKDSAEAVLKVFATTHCMTVTPARFKNARAWKPAPIEFVAVDPACHYCGADCSEGRSWDGGDLYACPPCAEKRAADHRWPRW
jgi:hypothetical protein